MKRLLPFVILTCLSFNGFAEPEHSAIKPYSIGVGVYSSALESDGFVDDEDFIDELGFSGEALSLSYAMTDQVAFRGTYFSLEEDDLSSLKSKGFDLNGYLGTRLLTHGIKAYVGGGFYRDKWSSGQVSETFSGLQLSGGVGYNWSSISLDLYINIRETSDYQKFIEDTSGFDKDVSFVTGSILLSYRF